MLCILFGVILYNFENGSDIQKEQLETEEMITRFLQNLFTSDQARYDKYVLNTGGDYNPIRRDKEFLNQSYNKEYINMYLNDCTENCLEVMENSGLFTYVDYLADYSETQVTVENLKFNINENNNDPKGREYFYSVTMNCVKEQYVESFTVQGKLILVNLGGRSKINFVLLSDYEALSIYITGDRINV